MIRTCTFLNSLSLNKSSKTIHLFIRTMCRIDEHIAKASFIYIARSSTKKQLRRSIFKIASEGYSKYIYLTGTLRNALRGYEKKYAFLSIPIKMLLLEKLRHRFSISNLIQTSNFIRIAETFRFLKTKKML